MFGIGTGELLLIALVALLVLGPERMPQLMRDVGKAVGDLRKTSEELQQEFLSADRKISAEKLLDVATRPSAPSEPATPTTQAEVTTAPETPAVETAAASAETIAPSAQTTAPPIPAEPEETAFDREARLARERIDRLG